MPDSIISFFFILNDPFNKFVNQINKRNRNNANHRLNHFLSIVEPFLNRFHRHPHQTNQNSSIHQINDQRNWKQYQSGDHFQIIKFIFFHVVFFNCLEPAMRSFLNRQTQKNGILHRRKSKHFSNISTIFVFHAFHPSCEPKPSFRAFCFSRWMKTMCLVNPNHFAINHFNVFIRFEKKFSEIAIFPSPRLQLFPFR